MAGSCGARGRHRGRAGLPVMTDQLCDRLVGVVDRLPDRDVVSLAAALAERSGLGRFRSRATSPIVRSACDAVAETSASLVAGVLVGAVSMRRARRSSVDVVWTGPSSGVCTSRLTAAAVVELIDRTTTRRSMGRAWPSGASMRVDCGGRRRAVRTPHPCTRRCSSSTGPSHSSAAPTSPAAQWGATSSAGYSSATRQSPPGSPSTWMTSCAGERLSAINDHPLPTKLRAHRSSMTWSKPCLHSAQVFGNQ